MKMNFLYLLASLFPLSLCLSSIQILELTCQHDTAQCNDSCVWNNSLSSCPSLQIQCLERHGKDHSTKMCNSFEECNLTKPLKFLENLIGNISCKHKDRTTKCQLSIPCNQTIYLCGEEDCELEHILNTGDNQKICKFKHDVTRCIQMGDMNCTKNTMITSKNSGRAGIPSTDCMPHTDKNDAHSFHIATICLGCLCVFFMAYIICIGKRKGWKTLNILKKGPVMSTPVPGDPASEVNVREEMRLLPTPGQGEHQPRDEEADSEQPGLPASDSVGA